VHGLVLVSGRRDIEIALWNISPLAVGRLHKAPAVLFGIHSNIDVALSCLASKCGREQQPVDHPTIIRVGDCGEVSRQQILATKAVR